MDVVCREKTLVKYGYDSTLGMVHDNPTLSAV